jgi:hypothetical protein
MTAFDDDEFVEEARTVRPYTVTGGRTRSGGQDLPMEALVRGLRAATDDSGMALERRRILELTNDRMLSVAELSAHLSLPLGVTRVLVGDLAADGAVVVHGTIAGSTTPATDLKVLESVLNGISAL